MDKVKHIYCHFGSRGIVVNALKDAELKAAFLVPLGLINGAGVSLNITRGESRHGPESSPPADLNGNVVSSTKFYVTGCSGNCHFTGTEMLFWWIVAAGCTGNCHFDKTILVMAWNTSRQAVVIKSARYTGGDFMFLYRFVRRRRRRRRPQILVHAITFEQLFGFLSFWPWPVDYLIRFCSIFVVTLT